MSEQVKRDCEHGRQVGKCVDCDYAALSNDYATLQVECERLRREAKNDAIAYRAVIERQNEIRCDRDAARSELAAIKAQEVDSITISKEGQELLAQCIGAHSYILGVLVNDRPDLAFLEAKKWVDGFSEVIKRLKAESVGKDGKRTQFTLPAVNPQLTTE